MERLDPMASTSTNQTQLTGRRWFRLPAWRLREIGAAYLFIIPSAFLFLVFVAGPMLTALGLSFFQYDILTSPKWVGLKNYAKFFGDERLRLVYRNTIYYVAGTVSIELVLALLLAVATQRKIPSVLRYIFRTAFFFPVLTSLASVSIIWGYLYHTDFGIINYYVRQLGGSSIPWLTSSRWGLVALIGLGVWKSVGFQFILFVAGLQNIPRHLYEAAELDGAGRLGTFFNITLPLLSPTMFFAVIISLINGFQIFDSPFIMTQGGPGDATRTVGMYIYEQGFRFFSMGYASTVSLSLFLVILVLTLIQFRASRVWVFYE
jgi:multiple sugar transport system permease protein